MAKSIRYALVRLEIEHPDNITPEAVINECWYKFQSNTPGATFNDTSIEEINETRD